MNDGFMVPEKDASAMLEARMNVIFKSDLDGKAEMHSKTIIEGGFGYDDIVEGFGKAVEYALENKRLKVIK